MKSILYTRLFLIIIVGSFASFTHTGETEAKHATSTQNEKNALWTRILQKMDKELAKTDNLSISDEVETVMEIIQKNGMNDALPAAFSLPDAFYEIENKISHTIPTIDDLSIVSLWNIHARSLINTKYLHPIKCCYVASLGIIDKPLTTSIIPDGEKLCDDVIKLTPQQATAATIRMYGLIKSTIKICLYERINKLPLQKQIAIHVRAALMKKEKDKSNCSGIRVYT